MSIRNSKAERYLIVSRRSKRISKSLATVFGHRGKYLHESWTKTEHLNNEKICGELTVIGTHFVSRFFEILPASFKRERERERETCPTISQTSVATSHPYVVHPHYGHGVGYKKHGQHFLSPTGSHWATLTTGSNSQQIKIPPPRQETAEATVEEAETLAQEILLMTSDTNYQNIFL